ncbi:MAG: entericidin A/B family lipoprotein [Planctomycetota bacterium]
MNKFNRALRTLAVCAIAVALAACNTTKGVGKDIEKVGEGLQNSADRHGAK